MTDLEVLVLSSYHIFRYRLTSLPSLRGDQAGIALKIFAKFRRINQKMTSPWNYEDDKVKNGSHQPHVVMYGGG